MKHISSKNILIAFSFLLIFSCKKEEKKIDNPVPVPAPTPDPYTYNNELQSSKDISFATYVISDLDMICAYASQGISGDYEATPSQSSSTTTIVSDTMVKQIVYACNNSRCKDGRLRNGAAFFYYGYDPTNNYWAQPNANHYESYGFSASVYLDDFRVNDWKVQIFDPSQPAHIRNTLAGDLYNPALTNLTWEISGKFQFINNLDPSRNLVWEGVIKKTLKNTSDTAVFANKKAKVKWHLAKLDYIGSFSGMRSSSQTLYTYKIDSNTPLYRDMTCSYAPQGATDVTEFHPFVFGKSVFTIGDYHPRTIDYGPTLNCDNKVNISFKDESHTEELD
ncbi:hypothetical protein [Aurantibacillus circumpalustris]|uniref:hypothetical protein n=1 Tax=Aurantibacillus circumpalustris TaxID=3036359 RepID=UPI00295BB7E4|nr:hypothetical protein [Aurantibacillus circumpalustris]